MELKPCPFCGGEATIEKINQKSLPCLWQVWCSGDNHEVSVLSDKSEKVAIAAWNRRCVDGKENRV